MSEPDINDGVGVDEILKHYNRSIPPANINREEWERMERRLANLEKNDRAKAQRLQVMSEEIASLHESLELAREAFRQLKT